MLFRESSAGAHNMVFTQWVAAFSLLGSLSVGNINRFVYVPFNLPARDRLRCLATGVGPW